MIKKIKLLLVFFLLPAIVSCSGTGTKTRPSISQSDKGNTNLFFSRDGGFIGGGVLAKIEVNGNEAHPLYNFLTEAMPGLLGLESIKWNFTKFLIDQKGRPIARFAPNTSPEKIEPKIKELLNH